MDVDSLRGPMAGDLIMLPGGKWERVNSIIEAYGATRPNAVYTVWFGTHKVDALVRYIVDEAVAPGHMIAGMTVDRRHWYLTQPDGSGLHSISGFEYDLVSRPATRKYGDVATKVATKVAGVGENTWL